MDIMNNLKFWFECVVEFFSFRAESADDTGIVCALQVVKTMAMVLAIGGIYTIVGMYMPSIIALGVAFGLVIVNMGRLVDQAYTNMVILGPDFGMLLNGVAFIVLLCICPVAAIFMAATLIAINR